MERAGKRLLELGAGAALVKGGHLPGDTMVDVLVTSAGRATLHRTRGCATTSTHGTGCTLSAAVTAGLALGRAARDRGGRRNRLRPPGARARRPAWAGGTVPSTTRVPHAPLRAATIPSISVAERTPAIRAGRSPSPPHDSARRRSRPRPRLVIVEMPRQRSPRACAAITSGTVHMPTASAPRRGEHPDLGGRLVARTGQGRVHALRQRDPARPCRFPSPAREVRRRIGGHVGKARLSLQARGRPADSGRSG